jgi:hypothetical protein
MTEECSMFIDVKQRVKPKELGILDSHYWGQCTELDPEQYRHKTSKPTVLQGHNLNRQEVNILRGRQARIHYFETPPTGRSSKIRILYYFLLIRVYRQLETY